jgi:hypothetical protein
MRYKWRFNFNQVSNSGESGAPIIRCLLFKRDCDEVLKVSFLAFVLLAAVKPLAAATVTFFKVPSAAEA